MAGSALDVETCHKLHQCWQDSLICHARWATLSEPEQQVIRQLYQQKSFDWGDSFRPAPVEAWWDSLCDGKSITPAAEPMDFRDVLPTRLDIEVNAFNGGLLTGIPSSYDHYLTRYGCKWPVGYEANICFAGENTLTVDFDTPWSPVGEDVVAALSQQYGGEVEHWFAEQGCNYCGYARYVSGETDVYVTDELEWGEADPDDEDSFPDVTGPEWIINNVAHFGGWRVNADRGITSRQFSSSASLCRESGLKGALKLARAWRKITTTPGLSDTDARPVSVRTRHTGSGWQPAAGGQEWPG